MMRVPLGISNLSIFVMWVGMVIEVRLSHSENAKSPILVTLLGIIVDAHPCINVLLLVSMIALQLSRES